MKFRIFGVDRALNSKLKQVESAIKDQELLNRVGRLSVSHIQKRTRDGLDVNLQPLKPLKDSTIKRREELAKYNRMSAYFSPLFSNLHLTGQLIRGVAYIVENSKVFVRVQGQRKPYASKSGRGGVAPTNAQVAKYQAEQGREFLGADDQLRQKIRETVVRAIRRLLRR